MMTVTKWSRPAVMKEVKGDAWAYNALAVIENGGQVFARVLKRRKGWRAAEVSDHSGKWLELYDAAGVMVAYSFRSDRV
jgi:hypothetical protein